jgi:transitional endoplasmic reticulum ATPase
MSNRNNSSGPDYFLGALMYIPMAAYWALPTMATFGLIEAEWHLTAAAVLALTCWGFHKLVHWVTLNQGAWWLTLIAIYPFLGGILLGIWNEVGGSWPLSIKRTTTYDDLWVSSLIAHAILMFLGGLGGCAGMADAIASARNQRDSGLQPAGEGSEADYNQLFQAQRARYTYRDVDGMAELKDQLNQQLGRFREEGGNGILLYGEPGNGKTFIAEAFAGEHGFAFLPARVTEMSSKWINETPEKVAALFQAAQRQGRVVLFLDEVDSLLSSRERDNAHAEDIKAANALLTAIADLNKGFGKHHQVLIMAATNFIDKLDAAGIREGRFDRKIEVPSPDLEARRGILLRQLDGVDLDQAGVESALKRWEGFSVSRMIAVGKAAKRLALSREATVDFDLLMAALREVQGRQGARLSEDTQSLDDLHLPASLRKTLKGIVRTLTERDKADAYGGAIPRGAVFFGPPGVGKTTIAKALAKATDWAFLPASGTELLENPDNIDKLIRQASDMRPTIVFIDEAEDLLRERGMSLPQVAQITNKLLAAMDGAKPLHDVFFVAATNAHPDEIDPAMLRWGRFSEILDFSPSREQLADMVRLFIERKSSELVMFTGSQEVLVNRLWQKRASPADVSGLFTRAITQRAIHGDEGEPILVDLETLI